MHLFTRSAPALLGVGALFAAPVAAQPPAFTTLSPPSFASGWRPAPAPSARLAAPSASPQVYDHGDPSPWEQLMLELINRARADPTGEAARFGIDLNEGLAPGTIAATPKPPLASHPRLIDAARAHSQWMLDTDVFDHVGVDGSSPGDRMSAAGYVFSGSWAWGENLAWRGTTGTVDTHAFTLALHEGLFRSPGHRTNTLNATFDELGVGLLAGLFFTEGRDWNALIATNKFARSAATPGPLLLGGTSPSNAAWPIACPHQTAVRWCRRAARRGSRHPEPTAPARAVPIKRAASWSNHHQTTVAGEGADRPRPSPPAPLPAGEGSLSPSPVGEGLG